MATIRDVAKLAGVSVATVSNILNGKASMKGETYGRVRRAMQALQYHPSYLARNLKSHKTRLAGVLLPSLDPPYGEIYQGILQALDESGCYAVLKLSQGDVRIEAEMLRSLADIGVMGLAAVPSGARSLRHYRAYAEGGLPLVLVESRLPGLDSHQVLFDNKTLVYARTRSLAARLPASSLLFIRSSVQNTAEQEAQEGFCSAAGAGRVLTVSRVRNEAFKQLFSALEEDGEQYRAAVVSDMPLALALYELLGLRGLSMEIHALAGDGWNLQPAYRSILPIARQAARAGEEAAALLLRAAESKCPMDKQTVRIRARADWAQEAIPVLPGRRSLRVLALDCESTDALERLSACAREQAGVGAVFDRVDYNTLKEAAEREALAAHSEYDLLMLDLPWLPHFVNRGLLYETGRALAAELTKKYPESIQKTFFRNLERRDIVPVVSGIQAIYYRRDCFSDPEMRAQFAAQYGFPLAVPRNWTEFRLISEFFTRGNNPLSPFDYGTAMTLSRPNARVNEFLPRQWAFHGHIVDKWGKVALDQDGSVRALQNLRQTAASACPQRAGGIDDEVIELLLRGEVPMVHSFTSHFIPDKYHGDTFENFIEVAPVPLYRSILGGWSLGVHRATAQPEACCNYLKWMLTDRAAVANMRMCGGIPTLAVYQDAGLRRQHKWLGFVDRVYANGGVREAVYDTFGRLVDPGLVDDILADAVAAALGSDADCYDILACARRRLERLIAGEAPADG
ncbi:extracellular solute-binding protein [Intestinibacillus massiliensis]|uniref:extracellular solute-binding protein n=1 Tax=Intestinibacillus massiliensis TaxID=1871029 RepID=UPI000B354D2E|nr:extracellular solute-binding protein [Intestinibacillus massiliensis]